MTWCCYAQTDILFKVELKPEKKYEQTIEQNSEMRIDYSGSAEVIQKLKEKGIQVNTTTVKSSKSQVVNATGKSRKDGHFPIRIEFVKTYSSDGKPAVADGTVIYGKALPGQMPTLDSISQADATDEYKRQMLSAMQYLFSQISYPEKKLKIGESFIRETPLSMPISGVTISFNIITTYKLISIKNGQAYINITQEYTMNGLTTTIPIKAKGKGKGTLVYDIANQFYSHYNIDGGLELHMKYDKHHDHPHQNFKVYIKSKNSYSLSAVISDAL